MRWMSWRVGGLGGVGEVGGWDVATSLEEARCKMRGQ